MASWPKMVWRSLNSAKKPKPCETLFGGAARVDFNAKALRVRRRKGELGRKSIGVRWWASTEYQIRSTR
jgi:hypothetical protein